jgi:ankyrin repeat protein
MTKKHTVNSPEEELHYLIGLTNPYKTYRDYDKVLVDIKRVLKAGANVNSKNEGGWLPLSAAVYQANYVERLDIVKLLIEHGAEINGRDRWDKTPLFFTCECQKNEQKQAAITAEFLLKHGANINHKDKVEQTPLHCAVKVGNHYATELLINKGAKVNEINNQGGTPLHLAAGSPAGAGWDNIVKLLLENDADPNIQDNNGDTPLHLACKYKNIWGTKQLLEKDASTTICDKWGTTPLQSAMLAGSLDITNIVMKYTPDKELKRVIKIDSQKFASFEPLMLAIKKEISLRKIKSKINKNLKEIDM